MRVIGVDPSERRTGLSKLDLTQPLNGNQPKVLTGLECAVVRSVAGTYTLDIVTEVHECILALLDGEELPVYIEVPVHGRNAGVLIRQGFLIGGLSSLLFLDGIRPRQVHPMHVKALLDIPRTPKGEKTDKGLVVEAIRSRIGDPVFMAGKSKDERLDREAVCDSIGVALVGVMFEGDDEDE